MVGSLHHKTGKLFMAMLLAAMATGVPQDAATAGVDGKPISLSDVVQSTISHSSEIIIASVQKELARADEQEASANFDPKLSASYALNYVRGYEFPKELRAMGEAGKQSTFMTDHQNNKALKLGLGGLFRTGIFSELSVEMLSSEDTKKKYDLQNGLSAMAALPAPARTALGVNNLSADAGSYMPVNPSSIQFMINIPMLKGRGDREMATSNETSKRLQREAADARISHAVATILNKSVVAYWNYKAALSTLDYRLQSEAKVKQWADKIPNVTSKAQPNARTAKKNTPATKGVDNTKPQANYTSVKEQIQGYLDKKANDVSAARQQVIAARNNLAAAAGIPAAEAQAVGQATDEFPRNWDSVMRSFNIDDASKRWTEMALAQRLDVKASRLEKDAMTALNEGAKNQLMPSLDLTLIAKRDGLELGKSGADGFANSLSENTGDLGFTGMIAMAYPIGNNKAESMVAKTNLGVMKNQSEYQDKLRTVALDVNTAANEIKNNLQQVQAIKRSLDSYGSALASAEASKIQQPSDVNNLMDSETRWIDAVVDFIKALNNTAASITNARYQTSTLVEPIQDIKQVKLTSLTELP
ncbi:MAG: TolC family protein [Magnetococcus sp. DMHC-1]|nr:TolC family protein [Magnetococcales bacterium]